jgi:peptidylprolyl isomerase
MGIMGIAGVNDDCPSNAAGDFRFSCPPHPPMMDRTMEWKPMRATRLRACILTVAAMLPLQANARTPDEVLSGSPKSDWQALNPADTLYMTLPTGTVIIALAPSFASKSIANIKALVAEKYFDDSSILRSQDNYVVQWSQDEVRAKAKAALPGYVEFERPLSSSFKALPDPDTYAATAGFDGGFAAASDGRTEWLAHCYGAVGVGRDTAADSGSGIELYAVTGQAPRHLDRNITLVGRVVRGMELLSSLPRGTGTLGFYETAREHTPILSIRLGSGLPAAARIQLDMLRTDSNTFRDYVEARRNRDIGWFVRPAGHIDICNIPIPVRAR